MTPLQLAVYDFHRDLIESGVCPTVRATMDQFGLKSTSEAARLRDALVQQGRLVKTKDRVGNLTLPTLDGSNDLTAVTTGALQAELERRGRPFHRRRRIVEHSATRPCAATGCVERVGRGRLFCRTHGDALPSGLQRELIEAYRLGREADYQDAWRRATDYLARRAAA